MASGTLIADNVRVGTVLEGPPLTVGSVRRVDAELSAEQRAAGRGNAAGRAGGRRGALVRPRRAGGAAGPAVADGPAGS